MSGCGNRPCNATCDTGKEVVDREDEYRKMFEMADCVSALTSVREIDDDIVYHIRSIAFVVMRDGCEYICERVVTSLCNTVLGLYGKDRFPIF